MKYTQLCVRVIRYIITVIKRVCVFYIYIYNVCVLYACV